MPNPRTISSALKQFSDTLDKNTKQESIQEPLWTHVWVMFGQFLAHDITATALNNSEIIKNILIKEQLYLLENININILCSMHFNK